MANYNNPYYVEPLGGLDIGAKVAGVIEAGKQYSRMKEAQEQLPVLMRSGTPDQVAQFMTKYPEMSGVVEKALTTKFNMDVNSLKKKAIDTLTTGEGNIEEAEKVLSLVDSQAFASYSRATGRGGYPADVQSFKYFSKGLTPDQVQQAKLVELGLEGRASESAEERSKKAYAAELAKLRARYELEPTVKKATTRAGKEAELAVSYVESGIASAEAYPTAQRSLELIDLIDTGGFDAALLKAKQWFGVETAEEGELQYNLLQAVLKQLRPTFGAQFAKDEGVWLKNIEASTNKSPEANKRLLQQLAKKLKRDAERGKRYAGESSPFYQDIDDLLNFSFTPGDELRNAKIMREDGSIDMEALGFGNLSDDPADWTDEESDAVAAALEKAGVL